MAKSAQVKVTIKLDRAGVRELLRSDEIAGTCASAAETISARAGGDYGISNAYKGKNRVNVEAYADDPQSLLRALH